MSAIRAITVIISSEDGNAMTILNLIEGKLTVHGDVNAAAEALDSLAELRSGAKEGEVPA